MNSLSEQSEKVKLHSSHTSAHIKGFFGEYRWLSNFHLCPVHFDGFSYPSSENFYQALKVKRGNRVFFQDVSPHESKLIRMAMIYSTEEWNNIRIQAMKLALLCKFTQNKDLFAQLLQTGDKYLEETNWWGDCFWGTDVNSVGQNNLGKLLMNLRNELHSHSDVLRLW